MPFLSERRYLPRRFPQRSRSYVSIRCSGPIDAIVFLPSKRDKARVNVMAWKGNRETGNFVGEDVKAIAKAKPFEFPAAGAKFNQTANRWL